MKALLRFQVTTLSRFFAWPMALVVAAAYALTWLAGLRGGWLGRTYMEVAVLLVAPIALWGMTVTWDALDRVRWVSPVAASRFLSAHLLFWTAMCAALATPLAMIRAAAGRDWALAFADLSILGTTGAAGVVAFHALLRRHTTASTIAAGALGLWTIGPMIQGIVMSLLDRREVAVALHVALLLVFSVVGVPLFLRGERLPSAVAGIAAIRDVAPNRRGPLSPTRSVFRGAWPPFDAWLYVVLGTAYPMLVGTTSLVSMLTAVAAFSLARLGLSSWRWLVATPIDRGRAFRLMFGPVLAFAVLAPSARIAVVELTTDRSEFLRDYRKDRVWPLPLNALGLVDVLTIGPSGNGYLAPDLQSVAARVREHIRIEFGLSVPRERVEADLRAVWPEHPVAGRGDEDETAVLDAIERVRVDFASELTAAARRRDLMFSASSVLGFLLLLRLLLLGGRRARPWTIAIVVLLVASLVAFHFVPRLSAESARLYETLQEPGSPLALVLLLAAPVAAVLLWRSSARAFRRLDVCDLPPVTEMWGRRRAS